VSRAEKRDKNMVSMRSTVTVPKSHSLTAIMKSNVHRMVRAAGTHGAGREQVSPPLACRFPGADRDQSHLRFFAATAAAIHLAISGAPALAMWDGKSAATGSCALGDAGDECRRASLARDQLASYSSAKSNSSKLGNAASGVPVADLNSQYVLETRKLGDAIIKYATADPYDEERLALVKQLKADGPVWVSKYARGGSARTLSARRFYIAVDAVEGHLASNGLAPFPRNKLEKLKTDIEDTDRLLEQGK
jgi:hypothetical protein